jgi:hypothetical protein
MNAVPKLFWAALLPRGMRGRNAMLQTSNRVGAAELKSWRQL